MDSANYSGTSQDSESEHPGRLGSVLDVSLEAEARICGSNSTRSITLLKTEDCLRKLSLNVNKSLVNKLGEPEFLHLLSNYDII